MPVFIAALGRILRPLVTGWMLPLSLAVFVFLSSWLAMWLVEPAPAEIVKPQNYPWYFVVTAATVGYGDFFPTSAAGHVVGAYVIISGIVALTMIFTRMAERLSTAKGNRMRGLADLDLHDHIVLLGYAEGRTERLVTELIAEPHVQLVLCAWDNVHEHPMPDADRVMFVRGDLTDSTVLARACVASAATVLIDGRDDNESLAIAVAVAHASRPSGERGSTENRTHLIVALRDMGRTGQFRYVSSRIQCVQWHVPNLLVEEAHDPGITQVYTELMTSGGSGDTFSLRLPRDFASFGEIQTALGQRFSATALAVRRDGRLAVSPSWNEPVAAGTTVYYVAANRLDPSAFAVDAT
ncbi:potassium channel protein [Antrihabitans stalactiti]|uniref:Ion transporter n=1 Tax=Antrihabitans stalactiti TaxID=2584121 RepID=A0A848KA87_9NOCA|nr:potassium channel family protein [Antrihabitans stalactiti]NMN95733.1 ion transporter [Antrihabitans stalactiti]